MTPKPVLEKPATTVALAATMLPGLVPQVLRLTRTDGRVTTVLLFVGSYLAVWALFGVAVYVFYRPHATFVAG